MAPLRCSRQLPVFGEPVPQSRLSLVEHRPIDKSYDQCVPKALNCLHRSERRRLRKDLQLNPQVLARRQVRANLSSALQGHQHRVLVRQDIFVL